MFLVREMSLFETVPVARRTGSRGRRGRSARLLGLLLPLILGLLSSPESSFPTEKPIAETLLQLTAEMPPLDLSREPSHSAAALAYFRFYQIEFAGVRHSFGSFDSTGFRLAAHAWIPESPRGAVFVLHGYLDHVGLLQRLVAHLLDLGFAVAAFDLPGHGLSSGERAGVGDFSEYASVLRDFIGICASRLPQPHHFVGHSTGCAIAFEYLQENEGPAFERAVFLAPLVHSAHWILSRVGAFLAKPFVETIPRQFRDNTSDREYLRFVRADPLRIEDVPLRWVKALYSWNERIQDYKTIDQRVLIIQGTDDDIVDWEYNIRFLRNKIDPATVQWIVGGKHQLANESHDLRSKVFSVMGEYLVGDRGRR